MSAGAGSQATPTGAGPLPPLVVLAGPTAAGKTALSLALAAALDGVEIVSADSRQVYRGMDVGTAKVTPAERARVPHHGIDLVEPDEAFSVADYRAHALRALAGIAERGSLALLVGGTGLYLRAVARGLELEPASHDAALRRRLELDLEHHGLGHLAAELRRRAPAVAAATDLVNPRRVVRALERVELVGDRLPPPPSGYPGPVLWLGVRPEAAELRARIAQRARDQFAGGLLEEAATLRSRFPPDLPAFSAFGYREAFAVLARELDRAAAVERTITRTTAFARRQGTWFRAEPGIRWLAPGSREEEALALVREFRESPTSAPLSARRASRPVLPRRARR